MANFFTELKRRHMFRAVAVFAVVALAVNMAVFPALAAECKSLSRVMSLDIKLLSGGRPGVPVMIGNTPEVFMVETSFIFSSVTSATAQKHGLRIERSNRWLSRFEGPNFEFAVSNQEVGLPSVIVGHLTQARPRLMIWPPTNIAAPPREWAGSLGADFLGTFDVDFDFAAGKLNLISPDHCPGQVVYWQAPVVAVVPMRLDTSANLWFPVMLDGKPIEALLNTGAIGSAISLVDAQLMFNVDVNAPDTERVRDIGGDPAFPIYRRTFKTLAIEGVTIASPRLLLSPDIVTVTQGTNGSLHHARHVDLEAIAQLHRLSRTQALHFGGGIGPFALSVMPYKKVQRSENDRCWR